MFIWLEYPRVFSKCLYRREKAASIRRAALLTPGTSSLPKR
jgi:hypothetical protein